MGMRPGPVVLYNRLQPVRFPGACRDRALRCAQYSYVQDRYQWRRSRRIRRAEVDNNPGSGQGQLCGLIFSEIFTVTSMRWMFA
jgi:hypothetical protein